MLIADGGNVTFVGNTSWEDVKKANFCGSYDLQIYHDGSNSFIDETGTGNLYVKSNSIVIFCYN
jgi:hypothetical protein